MKEGLLAPFYRLALFLYKKICTRDFPFFSSGQAEKDLLQMYPGENPEWIRADYHVKKLAIILAILFLGGILGTAAKFSARSMSVLEEGGAVSRGSYLDGEQELWMIADSKDGKQEFRLQLAPRTLTEQETQELFEEFLEKLPGQILGDNDDLSRVSADLELQEFYDGYPFTVEWESGSQGILSNEGILQKSDVEKEVELKACITYEPGGFCREESMIITVVPPEMTPEERIREELEAYLILSERESREKELFSFPSSWKGIQLQWSKKADDSSLTVWALTAAAAVLVWPLSDRDLHERLEKRKKCLKREYPDVVHKLVLFVGAGMTVRGAFRKMALDYEKKREAGEGARPAWDEILYTCRELNSGVSEGAAYEHFGRRTGLQEYIRLSSLLIQNLKKGNSMLLERLREEAQKAEEERLLQGKRIGEEAETKLLVPMVLMLAVVMVMIMVPAFGTL